MIRNLLIVFVLVLDLGSCFSQNITIDSIPSRIHANNAIEELNVEKNKKKVLFSISDKWYLIIVENDKTYIEYYLKKEAFKITYSTIDTIQKPNEFYQKVFNKNLYKKGLINFEVYKNYEIASGNPTYFVFKDEFGESFGELNLSTIIKPVPMDSVVYYKLLGRILQNIEKYNHW